MVFQLNEQVRAKLDEYFLVIESISKDTVQQAYSKKLAIQQMENETKPVWQIHGQHYMES